LISFSCSVVISIDFFVNFIESLLKETAVK
jgi:hypothetical protein